MFTQKQQIQKKNTNNKKLYVLIQTLVGKPFRNFKHFLSFRLFFHISSSQHAYDTRIIANCSINNDMGIYFAVLNDCHFPLTRSLAKLSSSCRRNQRQICSFYSSADSHNFIKGLKYTSHFRAKSAKISFTTQLRKPFRQNR